MAQKSNAFDDVVVIGAARHPFRDAYHSLLKMSWPGVLALIAATFLFVNFLFAILYVLVGGIGGMHEGSLRDAFFFSVQTMGTIGYGAVYPQSTAANVLVVAESVASLIMTALATGIVFARFSQTTGRLVFSKNVCIGPMNGVPTLMLRVGNDRASTIFEATVRIVLIRTEKTHEGMTFYRMTDLPLSRDRSPALARSWTVMHVIDEKSPLRDMSPSKCRLEEVELTVSVVGTDDTSLTPVHAQHRYVIDDIMWGARLADVLTEMPDGRLQMDVRKFHDIERTKPVDGFPYPVVDAQPASPPSSPASTGAGP